MNKSSEHLNMENEDCIELPYAGFFSRFIAFVLDYLLIVFVISLIMAIFMPADFAVRGPEAMRYDEEYIRELTDAAGPFMWVFYIAWWLYNALMHSGRWQATLGKRAMGIIVSDLEGERINFGKATLRFAGKLISTFILLIGYLLAAFTSRRQALHDMVGSTVVLKYRIPDEEKEINIQPK